MTGASRQPVQKEIRLDAETRLKAGAPARDASPTASLELGIDIGHVDLVCQIGSPHRIATLLQRVGRSGHTIGGLPKGRALPGVARRPRSECAALLRVGAREASSIAIVPRDAPLDVLAQQIVAECGVRASTARTSSSRSSAARGRIGISRAPTSTRSLRMTADGFATRRGRRARAGAPRRGQPARARPARRAAAARSPRAARSRKSPITASCWTPDDTFIGTAQRGLRDREQRRRHLSARQHVVADPAGPLQAWSAWPTRRGAPPTIPFWFGEGAGAQRRTVARGERSAAATSTRMLGATP